MRFAVLTMGCACLAMAMTVSPVDARARKVEQSTHSGTFVSAAAGKMVMVGQDGKEHTHAVAKDAKVTIDGKSGALAGLKKGMRISVTSDKAGTVTAISTSPVKPSTSTKPVAPAKTPTASTTPPTGAGK